MAQTGTEHIIPLKLSLTDGDYYTLWAPSWKQSGEEWQAFLGGNDKLYLFHTSGELLAFLESGQRHDLDSHPKWSYFSTLGDDRVVPGTAGDIDIIGVPALLAERPSHSAVSQVARAIAVTRSLADVLSVTKAQSFFSSYSVLNNLERGSDHYAAEGGMSEWTAVGRAVLTHWNGVVDALDAEVYTPEVDKTAAEQAQTRIDEAVREAAVARKRQEEELKAKANNVDPYDASIWGLSGIDPIKITVDGRILYTLRTYVGGQPVFLGTYGQITTFNSRKSMIRWLAEHNDHDLAKLATWPDIMLEVNGGTLEAMIHPDNTYTLTGLVEDINKGPKEVDTHQMRQAYELIADAADWAADDGVNSILVASPELQEYIAYMLGSGANYLPSAPYTKEAEGWQRLQDNLTSRFSKF